LAPNLRRKQKKINGLKPPPEGCFAYPTSEDAGNGCLTNHGRLYVFWRLKARVPNPIFVGMALMPKISEHLVKAGAQVFHYASLLFYCPIGHQQGHTSP